MNPDDNLLEWEDEDDNSDCIEISYPDDDFINHED